MIFCSFPISTGCHVASAAIVSAAPLRCYTTQTCHVALLPAESFSSSEYSEMWATSIGHSTYVRYAAESELDVMLNLHEGVEAIVNATGLRKGSAMLLGLSHGPDNTQYIVR